MSTKIEEILLTGSFILLNFILFFYLDKFGLNYSISFGAIPYLLWLLPFWFAYILLITIFNWHFFCNILKNHNILSYYLCYCGWIAYCYAIGIAVYLLSEGYYMHYLLEYLWNMFPLSIIAIIISLTIAYMRKHKLFI